MIIILLIILGCLSLILGILGIFIPGLPATPFLLLASISFVKSSPRLHKRLLDSRFGGYIKKYEDNPGMHLRTKVYVIFIMLSVCGISMFFFIPSLVLRIIVGIAGLIGSIVVSFFVPTIKD